MLEFTTFFLAGALVLSAFAWPDARGLVAPPLLHLSWLAGALGLVSVTWWEAARAVRARRGQAEGLVLGGRDRAAPDADSAGPRSPAGLGVADGKEARQRRGGGGPLTVEGVQLLEAQLRTRITGQDEAIQAVVDALNLSAVGASAKTRKPLATFLLAGATGTGKTELVKVTAEVLGRPLVRFDMPSFSSREGAARLVGAPLGVVRGDRGGQLTREVFRCPDAVVLLDEIEKADPEVWDSFLRVFDEGVLRDEVLQCDVDFTRVIVFLTSNLLSDHEAATPEAGPRRRLAEAGYFRPELVSRIDRIVLFAPLPPAVLRRIIGRVLLRMLAEFQARQRLRHLVVQVDASLVDLVLGRCDVRFGARDAQRQAEHLVGKAIAEAFLRSDTAWRDASSVRLSAEDGDVLVHLD